MSRIVQRWTLQLLISTIFNHIKNYIQRRNQDKRNALARFGSLATIEKVLGKFLKKFREQRKRRTHNKIKFGCQFVGSICSEFTENKSKMVLKQFMKDRKSKCMMFYCFNSIDRKVKIIQKRWKCKSEVNKARVNFLQLYWDNELRHIHLQYDSKENKTRTDKQIISKIFQINTDVRNEILRDYYLMCIRTYNIIFKTWHEYHKKIIKESTAMEILKNAFNAKFDTGEDEVSGVQSVLKQKTTELRRLNTQDLIEDYILDQKNIKHFDQINYTLEYQVFRMSKLNTKRLQRLRLSMINMLNIKIGLEEGFDDLYDEKELDPEIPPVFIFLPSRNLIRQMIVDAVLETSIDTKNNKA